MNKYALRMAFIWRMIIYFGFICAYCLRSVPGEDTVIPTKLNPETVLVESWFHNKFLCNRLKSLLLKVDTSIHRLEEEDNRNSTSATSSRFIHLTLRELNATRMMVFRSIGSLYRLIHNNVTDVSELKESSRARLKSLRSETVREEKAYSSIKELDEKIDKAIAANDSKTAKGLVDGIIKEVASSADKLQNSLTDHVFEKALNNPKLSNAANVEAVIRLDDEGKAAPKTPDAAGAKKGLALSGKAGRRANGTAAEDEDSAAADREEETPGKMVKLVDAHDNMFVLSKSKDSTVPLEDKTLILDLVYLVIAAAVLGLCCQVIGLPAMFGHILAGILLGPSGFSVLKSVVQIETVGQFGVFLILFCVGMEFSPDKVRPVLRVAVLASLVPALLLIGASVLAGRWFFHSSGSESAFVGACLSLSSTPLVVNFISTERHSEAAAAVAGPSTRGTADYSLLLLGILVMQDVYLCVLMALLPSLATTIGSHSGPVKVNWAYALLVFKLLLALSGTLLVTILLLRFVAGPAVRSSLRLGRAPALLLTLGTAFAYLLVTHLTNLSMELGCFLAGVVFSGLSRAQRTELEQMVEPVRDFLSAVFFVSIGLHVFPKFLLWELTLLSACTALVVAVKFLSCLLLLRLCVSANDRARRYLSLISAGLAQVSEFSFVLGSIARRLGLCSREIYLLVLGVTTLSQLVAPFLWKITLWRTTSDQRSSLCRRLLCCRRCHEAGLDEADGAVGAEDSAQALLKEHAPAASYHRADSRP